MPAIFGRGITGVYQIQSAFGTFPTTGNWIPLSAYEVSNGESRPREVDPLLGRGYYNRRDAVANAPGLPTAGGSIATPLCLREHGYWLCATFGAPVTTEDAGVFTHVWESGKDVVQALAQSKFLATGMYRRSRGLMVNTYALNLSKEAGYPRAALGVMQRDEQASNAQVSGTVLAALALLRPPAAAPFAKLNDVALPATALTFNYSNGLTPFNPLNGNEYPEALDPEDTAIAGSFTVRYESTTYDALADAQTPQPLDFGYILPNGLGEASPASITYRVENMLIDRSALAINTPGRLNQTYNFTGEQDASGPALTVTLVNDVEGYPPPP